MLWPPAAVIANCLRQAQDHLHPSMDCGDNVIVINCEKVPFTGKSATRRSITGTWLSPAASRSVAKDYLDGKHPDRVFEAVVRRMLPGASLKRQQLTNLRIYKGASHPHEAQNPVTLDVKAMNAKNSARD
ncbi:MAG: 50S ribosomal protein L13 [Hyphomicrobiales bacterium]